MNVTITNASGKPVTLGDIAAKRRITHWVLKEGIQKADTGAAYLRALDALEADLLRKGHRPTIKKIATPTITKVSVQDVSARLRAVAQQADADAAQADADFRRGNVLARAVPIGVAGPVANGQGGAAPARVGDVTA